MNKNEFAAKVEWEGWEYALREISPSLIEDSALAEALMDAQESFKILVDATPDIDVVFSLEDEDEGKELDFEQD